MLILITPFQAMYGRHAKIPIDLLVHLPDQEENVPAKSVKSFTTEREKELRRAYDTMKDSMDNLSAVVGANVILTTNYKSLSHSNQEIKYLYESSYKRTRWMTDSMRKFTLSSHRKMTFLCS